MNVYELSSVCMRVFVPTYAYEKENLLCERRITIMFDSDDDNGSNLFFGPVLKLYRKQKRDRTLVETLFFY